MKPRVAFFSFACCEGCQLAILNLEREILRLVEIVDIVNFREAMTEKSDDYDIAFIEGTLTRQSDEAALKEIRNRAKIVVALGACATTGGINVLKNFHPLAEVKERVYPGCEDCFDTYESRPIDECIKVDYYIHGCPIDNQEFLKVVKALATGQTPFVPTFPVCVECKIKENVCMYDMGRSCLGPVTRAGCGAICPSFGTGCEGCRGLIPEPNVNATRDILAKAGLTPEQVINQFRLFVGYRKENRK